MNFKPNIQKFKPKLLTFLLAAFISVITLSIINTPLTVHATEESTGGNGWSENGGQGSKAIVNGPSAAKQFWLAYITDESGALQSSVVLIRSGDINANLKYLYTRPEHGSQPYTDQFVGCDFGFSFDSQGRGRGTEIKNYLKEKNESGQVRAAREIETYWGTQMAEDWVSNQWYLVLENGLWCNVYKNGVNTGVSFAGTAYGWGLLQSNNNIGDAGDPLINRYTNNILPNSSKLQFSQTGLAKPTSSGKISNELMKTEGYGCLIIWAGNEGQTTCDIFIIII
jgi:hypothetical protein